MNELTLLPFATLDEARCHAQTLEAELAEIDRRMRALAERFKQTFPQPGPAHLAVHPQGIYRRLRWRKPGSAGRGQSFFILLDSALGQTLLNALSADERAAYLRFDREAMELSYGYNIRAYQSHWLRHYLDYRERLQAIEQPIG